MKKRLFYIVFACFTYTFVCAQTNSTQDTKMDQLFDDYLDALDNNPDLVLTYIDSIEDLAKKINSQSDIALSLRERGLFYSDRGDYVKAMIYMDSALVLDETIDNKEGAASDLLFIGMNFFDQGKTETALEYLLKARDVYKGMNDLDGVALINSNLGTVYRNLDQFENALAAFESAHSFYTENGMESHKAGVENNFGNIYKDLKQYDLALEYLFKAKEIKEAEQMHSSLMPTLANIGDIYVEQGRIKEAIEYYERAMELANNFKAMLLQKDISLDLSKAYERSGDEKRALAYFKDYNNYKDSLLSDDFNNDLANMKIKYDTDKKEKENLLLIKDNELKEVNIQNEKSKKVFFAVLTGIAAIGALFIFILFRNKKKLNTQLANINNKVNNQNSTLKVLNKELIDSENKLTASNQNKDQLISMLSHDLLNPVTAIANYTNQVSENLNAFNKQELETAFGRVQGAVVPLQDLLDNILQWAQYQNKTIAPRIESVDLHKVITKIIDLYQPGASFKAIEIKTDVNKDTIINTDRLMLFFIVRNLVNNSVKFSNTKGVININVLEISKEILLTLTDQGIGFNKEILRELNAPLEQNKVITTNGTGVGLSTSRAFVSLLKGTIIFENTNEGASVKLQLPKA